MIAHEALGETPYARAKQLKRYIAEEKLTFAGNRRLKIYGTLQCTSGRKMKPVNRVFFKDAGEAVSLGYRPCGHCLKAAYIQWKRNQTAQADKK